jgi:hypothetical protein
VNRQHNLKSGDVVEIQPSIVVGRFYLFTESKPDDNGKRTPGIAEFRSKEDVEILIADLQMLANEMS